MIDHFPFVISEIFVLGFYIKCGKTKMDVRNDTLLLVISTKAGFNFFTEMLFLNILNTSSKLLVDKNSISNTRILKEIKNRIINLVSIIDKDFDEHQ
jgi:hypothetical protein